MDCSKTIDFFSELKRVCDSRTECTTDAANKEQCPLFAFCRRPLVTQRAEEIIRTIESLQKWSNEHSKKTYVQDFFEKFPDAQSYSDGSPVICRKIIYGRIRPPFENCSYIGACYKCWNEPMEAADDE